MFSRVTCSTGSIDIRLLILKQLKLQLGFDNFDEAEWKTVGDSKQEETDCQDKPVEETRVEESTVDEEPGKQKKETKEEPMAKEEEPAMEPVQASKNENDALMERLRMLEMEVKTLKDENSAVKEEKKRLEMKVEDLEESETCSFCFT